MVVRKPVNDIQKSEFVNSDERLNQFFKSWDSSLYWVVDRPRALITARMIFSPSDAKENYYELLGNARKDIAVYHSNQIHRLSSKFKWFRRKQNEQQIEYHRSLMHNPVVLSINHDDAFRKIPLLDYKQRIWIVTDSKYDQTKRILESDIIVQVQTDPIFPFVTFKTERSGIEIIANVAGLSDQFIIRNRASKHNITNSVVFTDRVDAMHYFNTDRKPSDGTNEI